MDDKQHELTIHEFDALREEIGGYFTEMRRVEVYAALATALFDSFLISLESKGPAGTFHVPQWAWAVPILFPVLALIRGRAFNRQVELIASYIRTIEEQYQRVPLGWEHRMEDVRKSHRTFLGKSSRDFALVLTAFSVGVLLWRIFAH